MSAVNFPLSAGRKLLASFPAPSPASGEEHTGWSSPYLNEGTLNSNLAVILAAMVCALISALGLNLLLRCAHCYRSRMGVDGVAIRLANTGLKKTAMKAMPIVVYTSSSKLPPCWATDCPICLAEFREGEMVRLLPNCNHAFHMECIDKWLCSHSSCPMCRHRLYLLDGNQKPEGAPVVQATESNNAFNVVIETTDSTQAILETLERIPEEVTEVANSSRLPRSSVA